MSTTRSTRRRAKKSRKRDTSGPFEEAELEKAEEEKAESGESGKRRKAAKARKAKAKAPEEAETGATGGGAEAGAVVFSENCSTCHGATGHGGDGGPDLTTMPLAQSEEGAIQQVTNGGGGMPAFGGTLSEEEIENVAAYVAQEITDGE